MSCDTIRLFIILFIKLQMALYALSVWFYCTIISFWFFFWIKFEVRLPYSRMFDAPNVA